MQKSICILALYLFMLALNLFFRNEVARSITNGKHFSSTIVLLTELLKNKHFTERLEEHTPKKVGGCIGSK